MLHLWVATSAVKATTRRLAFDGSYAAATTLVGLPLRGRFELLYATLPPPPAGAAAWMLSRRRGVPLVFEVRDLWPQSAVAVGELTSPRAIAWATRLQEACYRRARRAVVITGGIRETLPRRGLPAARVELIPKGANTSLFVFSAKQRRRVREELGLGFAFTVVYAGLLGVAQGVEVLTGAAQRLAGRADIRFVLLGDGPERRRLEGMGWTRREAVLLLCLLGCALGWTAVLVSLAGPAEAYAIGAGVAVIAVAALIWLERRWQARRSGPDKESVQ